MVGETPHHRPSITPRTILVIEDDRDLAGLLELHLRDGGYEVHLAQDGAIGCRQAISKPYDLIILDLMLPSLSGLPAGANGLAAQ